MTRSVRARVGALLMSAAVIGATAVGSPVHALDGLSLPTRDTIVSSDVVPPQAGELGKVAAPSDDVMHPGSETEWWYVGIMDPASKRSFIAVIMSAPAPVVASVMLYPNGKTPFVPSADIPVPYVAAPVPAPPNDHLPGVRTPKAQLSFDTVRHAYHLVLQTPYKADVWFDGNPLPGVTGTTYLTDQGISGKWMGWSSPVGSSTVHGWVQSPLGRRISVNGWRGYHDHNWGNFNMYDQKYDGWEWGVSFEPDGGSSIIGGIVRPGGIWRGIVADVRPSGTRACLSRLTLGDWHAGMTPLDGATYALPGTVTATSAPGPTSCVTPDPGQDFTKVFHLQDPVVADTGFLAASVEARYNTVPGSFGLYEHIRELRARLETAGLNVPIAATDVRSYRSPLTGLLQRILGQAVQR